MWSIQNCIQLPTHYLMMTNYQSVIILNHSQLMQIDSIHLENVSNLALYSTNNELKKKAQLELQIFLFQLPLSSYQWLFQKHTTVVIFAAAATLNGHFSKIDNIPEHMDTINNIMKNWFKEDGRFVRRNGEELQDYCTNTIFFFLGKCLKEIYRAQSLDKIVVEWLMMPHQGDKYRLFLFLAFIENVSLIEQGIGFIDYRTLCTSFQKQIIPHIFSSLYPYFINFSQDFELDSLTLMQSNLSINNQSSLASMNKPLNKFNSCLFKLLSEIIQFKYDLNFKQFQESTQTMSTISFPEFIINQVIKKDFICSLYSIINRLVEVFDIKYFNICLQCLTKIVAAKITYIKEDLKAKFIGMHLIGLAQLLNNIFNRKINNVKIWIKVLECSDKFLNFFDQCTRDDLKNLQSSDQQAFKIWVEHIFVLPILIMNSGQPINVDNQLFQLSTEVMGRMGNQIIMQRIDQNVINLEAPFQKFVYLFFERFFKNNVNVLGQTTFKSLEDFKKTVFQFLQKIAKTASACYLIIFSEIKRLLVDYVINFEQNAVNLSNVILFFTALIQCDVLFQRNVLQFQLFEQKVQHFQTIGYQHPTQITALVQLFMGMFQFIKIYSQSFCSKPVNIALTLFYQSFFTKLSNSTVARHKVEELLQAQQPIEIQNILFKFLKARMALSEQQFMLSGLIGLSKLIKHSEITCIEFIFSCLYKLILKLKHKFTKQIFKDTQIYKEMLKLFMELIGEKLSSDMMKWRILLFKTVSLLCYDDTLDQFRVNVKSTIKAIKEAAEDQLDRVLYDLTGICDGIQSESIFSYFLTKFCSEINYSELLEKFYLKYANNSAYLKDILRLTYLFFKAKQKTQNCRIARISYYLLRSNLPFWCKILEDYGCSQQKTQLLEQLYPIYKALIVDGNINISIADEQFPSQIRVFLKHMFNHLIYFMDVVQNYPDLLIIYCQAIEYTFIHLKKFIYNHKDVELPQKMTFLANKLMQKLINSFEMVINEDINPAMFAMLLTFFQKYFEFLLNSKHQKHRLMFREYLPTLIQVNELKQRFLATVFMLGIHFGNRKDAHTIALLTTIAHSATSCYDFNVGLMIQRIGLKTEKDKTEFTRIMDNIKRNLEEWSNLQLKDWFNDELRYGKPICIEDEGGY